MFLFATCSGCARNALECRVAPCFEKKSPLVGIKRAPYMTTSLRIPGGGENFPLSKLSPSKLSPSNPPPPCNPQYLSVGGQQSVTSSQFFATGRS